MAEAALLGAPRPTLLDQTDGIPFEKVAALSPDLIIGLYSGLTQQDYDTLAKIAPTVAQPAGQEDHNISWQDTTTTLGKILGKTEQAEKLIDDTEKLFTEQRNAHPEFTGKSAVMATVFEDYFFFGAKDPSGQLLTSLGFTVPPALQAYIDADGFGGTIPGQGREVFVPETEPAGMSASFVTPLSIPFLLDNRVPRLSAAVDGNPATAA